LLINEISEGLCCIINKIKSFPDIFSCTGQWSSYTDIEYLRQIREWGGSSLLSFLIEIMNKTTCLLRGNKVIINHKERNKNLVSIYNVIFKEIITSGSFQFVPAYEHALFLKTLTDSSLAVSILGKIYPGAPGSDVVLCNALDKASTAITKIIKEPGNNNQNLRVICDNAPVGSKYSMGSSSIYTTLFTAVITLFMWITMSDNTKKDVPFHQNDPDNDPRLWKERFDSVPDNICDKTEVGKQMKETYAKSKIQICLNLMIKDGYVRNDGQKSSNVKPVLRPQKILPLNELNCREGKGKREIPVSVSYQSLLNIIHSINPFSSLISNNKNDNTNDDDSDRNLLYYLLL
jgi:hypothetical protein